MKFTIFTCQDGRFLMNITFSREKIESHVFTAEERYKMFEKINSLLGDEPPELKERMDKIGSGN